MVIKKVIDDIYNLETENIRIIVSGEYQGHIKNKAGDAFSYVVVTGSPNPEIPWFKDRKKIDGTKRLILGLRKKGF